MSSQRHVLSFLVFILSLSFVYFLSEFMNSRIHVGVISYKGEEISLYHYWDIDMNFFYPDQLLKDKTRLVDYDVILINDPYLLNLLESQLSDFLNSSNKLLIIKSSASCYKLPDFLSNWLGIDMTNCYYNINKPITNENISFWGYQTLEMSPNWINLSYIDSVPVLIKRRYNNSTILVLSAFSPINNQTFFYNSDLNKRYGKFFFNLIKNNTTKHPNYVYLFLAGINLICIFIIFTIWRVKDYETQI